MKALLAALLLGVALGAGATAWLGRPDPALRARADSLAAAHAVADALRDDRATAERDTVWLVRRAAGARLAALDTAGAAVDRLSDSLTAAAPDTCLPILAALDSAFAGFRRATDSLLRLDALALVAEQGRTAYWRDTVRVDLMGERDDAMQLVRDAIRARNRRVVRVAVVAAALGLVMGKVF